MLRQFSLMVPYLTALVPEAPVAHIPQMLAFAPVPKRDMKHIKLSDEFRGITWVDGKPKAVVLNKVIKCFSRHPRPDANVEILRVVVRYLIHLLEVDANSTVQSRNSGLESGASSMRDNWNIFLVANFTNLKKSNAFYIKPVHPLPYCSTV